MGATLKIAVLLCVLDSSCPPDTPVPHAQVSRCFQFSGAPRPPDLYLCPAPVMQIAPK